ncbi:MAG TPA: ribose 5-phosphate isomerase B [Gemmatimonadaceae bacterium]|nr:ribose 5-phosphate isomerase B [Gemmatimonadaceae bacterium]
MAEQIPIGSDHAGFEMKGRLAQVLASRGFEVADRGTNSADSTDYADYAHDVAREVSTGAAKRGILLCGTGLGMSYAANRWPHVRAAVAWTPDVAKLAREHNDANILVLPARCISDEYAVKILEAWLDTPFEGGRHERRIAKIERADGEGEA